jgi:hypothetical protein
LEIPRIEELYALLTNIHHGVVLMLREPIYKRRIHNFVVRSERVMVLLTSQKVHGILLA